MNLGKFTDDVALYYDNEAMKLLANEMYANQKQCAWSSIELYGDFTHDKARQQTSATLLWFISKLISNGEVSHLHLTTSCAWKFLQLQSHAASYKHLMQSSWKFRQKITPEMKSTPKNPSPSPSWCFCLLGGQPVTYSSNQIPLV